MPTRRRRLWFPMTRRILARIALLFRGPPRYSSRDDRHESLIDRVLATVDPDRDPALAARLHAFRAIMEPSSSRASVGYTQRAVELADRAGDLQATCDAYHARFWVVTPQKDVLSDALVMLDAARASDPRGRSSRHSPRMRRGWSAR